MARVSTLAENVYRVTGISTIRAITVKNKSESLLSAPDLSPKSRPTGAGHENHQKQTVRLLPRIMIASREVTVNDLFNYF